MTSRRVLTATLPLRCLHSQSNASARTVHVNPISARFPPLLSRPLFSSPSVHRLSTLPAPHRSLATATASASATSHTQSTLPTQPPHSHPPVTATLSPSQLRAASAARAQKAVADAKAFEENRARTLRNKNIALAIGLIVFVVWCYQFSVYSVRKSADSLTGSDVVEIERELDEEERVLAGDKK